MAELESDGVIDVTSQALTSAANTRINDIAVTSVRVLERQRVLLARVHRRVQLEQAAPRKLYLNFSDGSEAVIKGSEDDARQFGLQGIAHIDCAKRVESNVAFAFDCAGSASDVPPSKRL